MTINNVRVNSLTSIISDYKHLLSFFLFSHNSLNFARNAYFNPFDETRNDIFEKDDKKNCILTIVIADNASELPISQLNVRFITHLLIDRYYEILTKAASLKSVLYFTLPSSSLSPLVW